MEPTQWSMPPHWLAMEAVGAILGPHHPTGAIVPVGILEGRQTALKESKLVNI